MVTTAKDSRDWSQDSVSSPEGFKKRFYTPRTFWRDLRDLVSHLPQFRESARSGRVSRGFAEKIMMAVTAVNGCRYCARFHTGLALREGVPAEEIERILSAELGTFPEEEAVALAFAQHWAETAGQPDPVAERRFREYYGPQISDDLLHWMRMIRFGNLAGNTWDAILWRLGIGGAQN
jgi:AhpD family alkylhydroperoxidase